MTVLTWTHTSRGTRRPMFEVRLLSGGEGEERTEGGLSVMEPKSVTHTRVKMKVKVLAWTKI